MAGNYPDVPSWRMAYDKDGTQVLAISMANVVTSLTSTQMRYINDESALSIYDQGTYNDGEELVFMFPELRDFDGIFMAVTQLFDRDIQRRVLVSPNSTNGVDGDWEEIISGAVANKDTIPDYRNEIISATALGIKAVKIDFAPLTWWPNVKTVHLYGEIAPGQNPNRLALWHPSLNQRVGQAYFDWGNTARSSSADRQFRVKNLSSTLTAVAPRVAMDALTDTTPSVPGQHSLSQDAVTFGSQQTIPDLAPGAISAPLTLRRVTPTNAVLSLWAFRLFCEANSWS